MCKHSIRAEIVRTVRELHKQELAAERDENEELGDGDDGHETDARRRTLHQVLTTKIDPSAFERLVQRILRESGFIHVEVTGRSGDGGIDGKGIVRINGMLSFHVHFQCKRYQASVSASHIRDFRVQWLAVPTRDCSSPLVHLHVMQSVNQLATVRHRLI